jgi:hypothetical protein
MTDGRKPQDDPFEQFRESARLIDQAIGHGSRMLDLVERVQKTPTHKLVGSMLVGLGRALEKADSLPNRKRPRR